MYSKTRLPGSGHPEASGAESRIETPREGVGATITDAFNLTFIYLAGKSDMHVASEKSTCRSEMYSWGTLFDIIHLY